MTDNLALRQVAEEKSALKRAQVMANRSSVYYGQLVIKALERLVPLPERKELQYLRSFVRLAYEEACIVAAKVEPSPADLEYIRYLESEAKKFSAPVTTEATPSPTSKCNGSSPT
jgi:hypothetical protein